MLKEIPPPLIILCPPRSLSSIVCAALGQHPELYGFPELNLCVSDSLGDLLELDLIQEQQTGLQFSYLAGLLRVLMCLWQVPETEEAVKQAVVWLQKRKSWSTRQIFDFLLDQIQPCRGIDKSPRTALSRKNMLRVLRFYPDAKFLHLTRHPVTSQRSLQNCRTWLSGATFHATQQTDFSSLANFSAHLWCHVHQGILDFTNNLSTDQTIRIQGEKLLKEPKIHLLRIAEWLGIRTDSIAIEAMAHPEKSPYATVGILPAGLENDSNFLQNPHLRLIEQPVSLEMPSEWQIQPWLEERTQSLAQNLGYK